MKLASTGLEALLASLAINGISTISKTAFSYASQYAVRQLGGQIERMLKDKGKDSNGLANVNTKTAVKIRKYKNQIEAKMAIVTPCIELAELLGLRGNSMLLPVVHQAKEIVASIEHINVDKSNEDDIYIFLETTLADLKDLIQDLNLSFTMSQINAQQSWSKLSASSLIQASQALRKQRVPESSDVVSIFSSSRMVFYSLFEASIRNNSNWTWKEEFALANIEIICKMSNEKPYEICVTESFDDDRVHEGSPRSKAIMVESISSLSFAPTGQLLNIPDLSSPVLLLKLSPIALASVTGTPVSKSGIEWIAIGHFEDTGKNSSDEDSDEDDLALDDEDGNDNSTEQAKSGNLAVLECLLKLCLAETREGKDAASLPDEILNIYLSGESNHEAPLYDTHTPRRSIKSPQSGATPIPSNYNTTSAGIDLHGDSPRPTTKGLRSMSDRLSSMSPGSTK